jgi:Tol biopolymer transport system component/predicted Ser/Thr protein kinase
MALPAGTRLGPYEILAPIGAGGMGEVYRARDTKLDREVAIKVLPAALAQDPERLARFEREAKVLAALNHPNIAQIYGVEEQALVMELVPGESVKGPLPLETALNYAKQIADALEVAHDKGIVHRDLKPANIMVTPDGVVKVLDFGLAAVAQSSDPSNPANSPTLTISPTRAGMILGTAAYMSPEQARGKAVDKRADIWAFGVVLFEMFTGKRLFEGETVSDTLAEVLTKEPDWGRVPAKVRWLLEACLQKDPKLRLQAIGDWRLLLTDVQQQVIAPSRSRLGWVSAVLAVIAAGTSFIAWRAMRPVDQPLKPLLRLDVDLGSGVSLGLLSGTDVIISPDGTRIVYGSQNRLFTRRLDQRRATELAGTEGAAAPFISPDGQWVAFFAGGKLKKTSMEGGGAIALCDAGADPKGGSWGEDGNIIAALNQPDGLWQVPSAGGAPVLLTQLAQGETGYQYGWPQILPGGKAALFTYGTANIEIISLRDRHRKMLVRGIFGRYLPSGHLVYVGMGTSTLFAVPFDLDKLEVRGTPVPVLEQIASSWRGDAQLDFSRSGTLVYRGGEGNELFTVQWLDGTGKVEPLLAKPGSYERPSLSPDGQRLALEVIEGSSADIWVYDWQPDTMRRLTFTGRNNAPRWSPDGRYIVFHAVGAGMSLMRSDGAGQLQPLTKSRNTQYPTSFTPDGKLLAYMERSGSTWGLWTVPVESYGRERKDAKPEVFLQTSADERNPSFSPDGRWMAYSSNETGTFQVYVRAFPDRVGQWQISNSGGTYPMWSHNGHELFFETFDNRIMVAAFTVKGDSFVADKPRVWSEKRLGGLVNIKNVDLAPDGKRVAALMPAETPDAEQAQNHVIFLENFFDELRRRVPARK